MFCRTVHELDSQPVADTVEAIFPQLTMAEEIAFLKAKILEMEIEKREGAKVAPLPTSQGHILRGSSYFGTSGSEIDCEGTFEIGMD